MASIAKKIDRFKYIRDAKMNLSSVILSKSAKANECILCEFYYAEVQNLAKLIYGN